MIDAAPFQQAQGPDPAEGWDAPALSFPVEIIEPVLCIL